MSLRLLEAVCPTIKFLTNPEPRAYTGISKTPLMWLILGKLRSLHYKRFLDPILQSLVWTHCVLVFERAGPDRDKWPELLPLMAFLWTKSNSVFHRPSQHLWLGCQCLSFTASISISSSHQTFFFSYPETRSHLPASTTGWWEIVSLINKQRAEANWAGGKNPSLETWFQTI